MSSHAENKYEGWTNEQFIEEIEELEKQVEQLELDADAEPEIDAFSDEQISDEFHARGLGLDAEEVTAMFNAFYLGREQQAVEIAKRIASAHMGRGL